MTLKRHSQTIDGSIPVQALLYDEEELLGTQDNVGIYDGPQKAPEYQNGTVYMTSHRLFYVDAKRPEQRSFTVDLETVSQTEYYAGLFTSSPKITLHFSAKNPGQHSVVAQGSALTWECQVCAYRNPPGLSPAASRICGLCGVPREALPGEQQHISASLPSSGAASPAPQQEDSIQCPVCTFLNHSSLRSCEMCEAKLPQDRREMKSAPASRPESPEWEDDPTTRFIKFSFRKGGDKAFYAVLKRGLQTKAWKAKKKNSVTSGTVGISGILQTVETSAQARETSINDALQDLEALMVKAKDMVRVAAELNEKLTNATSTEPEEATFIRTSLAQLGLQLDNAPVTQDMIKDESKWNDELARELARVLQGSGALMRDRGIIALDEVWGGWNRARGVALIPPSTFLQVLPLLPQHTNPPIMRRTFASGLQVLHTPPYSREAFAARLCGSIVSSGPLTTMEIALHEELAVGLVREMVEAGEAEGDFCRDDIGESAIEGGGSGTGAEVRWWPNVLIGYVWDGQLD